MKRVYFDNAATTPVREEVLEAMLPYLKEKFGNASSLHEYGREARNAIDIAREHVAKLINAKPEEIFFTSGGTESDNFAIKGVAERNIKKGKHVITSSIEHHAVLETCHHLEKKGYEVTYLPVDKYGKVLLKDVKDAMREDTVLVSIMFANNEIGTIQDVEEIGKIAHEYGAYFHTDAVQAFGHVPIDVEKMHIDLLSLSGHKLYAPKGVGALYIRKGTRIEAIQHGGAHERKRRAGTENVPGIVALGEAARLAALEMDEERARLEKLRDRLIKEVLGSFSHVRLNGHPQDRLPGNANFSFELIEGEALLLSLDLVGIAASSGSACSSGTFEPSHVLTAIGLPTQVAYGSVRLTLGRGNTDGDIDYFLTVMPEIIERLEAMSPVAKL